MGYGVATDYGYNMTGNFADAGVPIPTDLAARLAGEDGVLLKVTGLSADEAFWEAVRQALAGVTVNWSDPLRNYFNGTNIDGDVEMTVTGGEYQTATNLGGQGLRKLTLNLPSGFVSVMSNAFIWAVSLEEFVVNGTVKANDWTGAFDHCTALTSFTAPQWNDNALLAAYSYGVSYMTSAFQNCTALTAVPQYGAEREADANTLRPVAMQNMLNASGVTVLGPVVDMRYIDPAGTQAAGAFGTQLQDARLMNLNHGDWWLDGTVPENGVSHGNLSNLDAESVAYLMAHLWDLTTDKVGKNWRTTDNSWKMWTYEHTQELTDARAVVNFSIAPTGANANSWLRTQSALNGFKFRVTGLAEGDRLEFGAGVVAPTEASIYEDGEYVISKPNGLQGFKLYNDTETGTRVLTFEIVAPYDAGNHLVDAAALHVPEGWRAKLTTDMLASAAARGWSVWIGEENLTAALPSIFDSLVLWYDISKQGATNETMAANPVLKDLSGHGHDATCYNFGWEGMSGIGGYKWIFADFRYKNFPYSGNTITLTHSDKTAFETDFGNTFIIQNNGLPGTSVKVTGMQPGDSFQLYNQINASGGEEYPPIAKSLIIVEDGIYSVDDNVLPESYIGELQNGYIGFRAIRITEGHEVTVEQLPQYPNALVSDGVDDYALVEGLPLLDDFTFITKRTINVQKANSIGVVKGESGIVNQNNAFGFDIINNRGAYYYTSFGSPNLNPGGGALKNAEIVVGTPNTINGLAVQRGAIVDNFPYLWLMGYLDSACFAEEQLYTFLLFDRTLTSEEIEWVKNNLIENNTEA